MKFNLKKVFSLLLALLFLALLCLSVSGCGASKKQYDKNEEITKSDESLEIRNSGNSEEILNSVSNLNVATLIKIDDQNLSVTTKKTFTPQNPTLPAHYTDSEGKRHELNNTSYSEETIVEKKNRKLEKSEKSEEILKQDSQKKASATTEIKAGAKKAAKKLIVSDHTDRKQWTFPIYYIILIIIIVLVVLWYLNKRYQWIKHVTAFIAGLFQFRKK